MKATKAQVLKRAAELNVTIEHSEAGEDHPEITAYAPDGYWVAGVSLHGGVASWMPEFGETKAQAWGAIFDDLSGGIEPCPDGADCFCQERA